MLCNAHRVLEPGPELRAQEQSIFSGVGTRARILIQVELERKQRHSTIASTSRFSQFLIVFIIVFNLSKQCELLPECVKAA